MSITFKEITIDNFRECIGLTVRDDQKFVAPNVVSIAQSKIEPKYIPLAIYNDETMVGFLMYAFEYADKELYLCRFMIDQNFQHKGYGKGALDILKEIAMQDPGVEKIELSTKPTNVYGIRVYEKFGFKDTGILDDGEEIFVLDLGKHPPE
ncbi:MAG: hypothetical protein CVU39_01710 [Chloroflexi bacterium HGW-Chloroflexi-10]|nr:MAG: hypothetical protein CVU39_01710 [Chloroflexi bacterium HGW-Chloroflexi-10]